MKTANCSSVRSRLSQLRLTVKTRTRAAIQNATVTRSEGEALLRQMLAFRNGMRVNEASPQMNAVVENLTLEEMIEIVAYVASLPP